VVFRLARDGATKYCEGVTRFDIAQEYYIAYDITTGAARPTK
jgi:hypothetical protein